MKKVRQEVVYCIRCGDEIPPLELMMSSGSMCALCEHMQFEAQQIMAERHELKQKKTLLTSLNPFTANLR